jgi:hypothetical protein
MSYPIGTILVGDPEGEEGQIVDLYETTSGTDCLHIGVCSKDYGYVSFNVIREHRTYLGNSVQIPELEHSISYKPIRVRVASEAEAFEIRLKLLIPTE